MDRIRVLVTGCRSWKCDTLARRIVERLVRRYTKDGVRILHEAGLEGVGAAFERAARQYDVPRTDYRADWKRYGDRAVGMRNQEMVDSGPAFAIAVHRTLVKSKSTRDCVFRCFEAGIPVYLLNSIKAEPRHIRSFDDAKR